MGETTTTNTTSVIDVCPPSPTQPSPHQALALIAQGEEQRHVGATELNAESSRSHTIFRLLIESRPVYVTFAQCVVYDGWVNLSQGPYLYSIHPSHHQRGRRPLALLHPLTHRLGRLGERQAHQRHGRPPAGRSVAQKQNGLDGSFSLRWSGLAPPPVPARARRLLCHETGNYINKSLLALGHVIQKLSEASSRGSIRGGENATHVPFRCVCVWGDLVNLAG